MPSCVTMTTLKVVVFILMCYHEGFCQEIDGLVRRLFPGQVSSVMWTDEDGTGFSRLMCSGVTNSTWSRTVSMEYLIAAQTSEHEMISVDIDYGNNTIVAFDKKTKSILAVEFDPVQLTRIYWTLFKGTSAEVYGLAVDWTNDLVYWTDAAYNTISAVSMTRPHQAKVIVDQDLDTPYGLAVEPASRYLFWSEIGSGKKIFRSSLSGQHKKEIYTSAVYQPTSLAVDYLEERLYWVFIHEYEGYGVGSCTFNGNDVTRFYAHSHHGVYRDLAIFKGQLFALQMNQANEHELHVYKVNNGIQLSKAFRTSLKAEPYGILIVDRDMQYSLNRHPCERPDCPGICIHDECLCTGAQREMADNSSYCDPEPFSGLLFLKSNGIYRVERNFAEYGPSVNIDLEIVLPSEGSSVRAMTSDFSARKLFFYEYSTKIIKVVDTAKGQSSRVVSLAVEAVGGLAVDWLNKNLYWTDMKLKHIMVSDTEGRYQVVLFRERSKPVAIAVNPLNRTMFWSDHLDRTISRAFLDGSDERVICINSRNDVPYCRAEDIAIDFKSDRIYWCTNYPTEGNIFKANHDGSDRQLISSQPNAVYTGLTVMADYIVTSDTSHKKSGLRALDKEGRSPVGEMLLPWYRMGNFFGVHYHHKSTQKGTVGNCTVNGRSCDQVCLPGNYTNRCACSIGYTLVNKTHCVTGVTEDGTFKYYLLVSDLRYQKLFHIYIGGLVAIPVQGLQQPYAIVYDIVKEMVYWTDLDASTLSRATLQGEQQSILLYDPDSYYLGLALDTFARLLYFTVRPKYDGVSGYIRVLNVDTLSVYDLVRLERPHGIAVNIHPGTPSYIFYTDNDTIFRVNPDGSNKTAIDIGVRSTAVTTYSGRLYLTHSYHGNNRIYSCDLDGANGKIFQDFGPFTKASALTVDAHRVYWTNFTHRRIHRSDMDNPLTSSIVGDTDTFIQPVGIYANAWIKNNGGPCTENSGECDGMCLPTSPDPTCVEATPINRTEDFCTIPVIKNGFVAGNHPGNMVPDGYQAMVKCYPAHTVTPAIYKTANIECISGLFVEIPECTLDYSICGSVEKGYKAYTEDGVFYLYPEFSELEVVTIGGGGGGYDVTDFMMELGTGHAGDGTISMFGSDRNGRQYVRATGGRGGSKTEGGAGGKGSYKGSQGAGPDSCTLGGAAGVFEDVGISEGYFCGFGGIAAGCDYTGVLSSSNVTNPTRAGGLLGNDTNGGLYGGGAAGNHGGAGGGGGYVLTRVFVSDNPKSGVLGRKELVKIVVGRGGIPSYGTAASGLVLVAWGDFDIRQLAKKYGHDVTTRCVPVE